jgi:hypothetical protein
VLPRQVAGTSTQLKAEPKSVHRQHAQLADERRSPDSGPVVPSVSCAEGRIAHREAAHAAWMRGHPSRGSNSAEVMRYEMDRFLEI